jgi:uncharacterized protein
MTPAFAVALGAGAILGGFVQGLSGFGFGLLAMTVWAWTIAPRLVGPLVVWGSCLCQLLGLLALRRGLTLGRSLPFVLGGLLGAPAGALLLPYVDVPLFRGVTGLFLVTYCSVTLLARYLPTVAWGGRGMDAAVGMLGGLMGGLSGLTGPAPTLWCTLRGWDKDTQRAVFQTFNLSMQSLTLVTYALDGTLRPAMLPAFALMLPVVVLPTFAGVALYRRFSFAGFRYLVLLMLLASGVAMLASFAFG